jgi:DNA-binding transcriptional MerR regulator
MPARSKLITDTMSLREVAQHCGLPESTLKFWYWQKSKGKEKYANLPEPARSPSGHYRSWTKEQADELKKMVCT